MLILLINNGQTQIVRENNPVILANPVFYKAAKMQYVLVKFRENRQVVVDDHYSGYTNEVIEIEEGNHSISMAAPYDFSPHEWRVVLMNTTVVQPLEVEFK